jgi:hypothetical protein
LPFCKFCFFFFNLVFQFQFVIFYSFQLGPYCFDFCFFFLGSFVKVLFIFNLILSSKFSNIIFFNLVILLLIYYFFLVSFVKVLVVFNFTLQSKFVVFCFFVFSSLILIFLTLFLLLFFCFQFNHLIKGLLLPTNLFLFWFLSFFFDLLFFF